VTTLITTEMRTTADDLSFALLDCTATLDDIFTESAFLKRDLRIPNTPYRSDPDND
jgi:hypothetical protein